MARLIPGKGVKTLLEAVSLVAKILPRLHLVVVGDGRNGPGWKLTASAWDWRDGCAFWAGGMMYPA